jgi:hypothetical protein
MALMRRLAEGAAASGDLASAVEAVRACMAEAECLYQQAMTEKGKALALARQAAEDHARAKLLREEAAKALEDAEGRRGRHAPDTPANDAPGHLLRPDPGRAQTPREFIGALRQFRTWAGNPSYRDMARACDDRLHSSTICKILGKEELPARFEVIDAIITACGGSEEDRERFATAWRRLSMPREVSEPAPGRVRPASATPAGDTGVRAAGPGHQPALQPGVTAGQVHP